MAIPALEIGCCFTEKSKDEKGEQINNVPLFTRV